MTSKLKCPLCQQDLRTVLDSPFYTCDSCGYTGYKQLWQTLIQEKQNVDFFIKEQIRTQTALIERTKELDKCQKDLEIARKALEDLRGDKSFPPQTPWEIIADKALEQIKHKEVK